MWKTATAVLMTTAMLGVAACGDDDPTGPDATFGATLTAEGDVESTATGTATFAWEDGVMTYSINVSDITAVRAAHIHGPAGPGEGAGVIVPLFGGPETGPVNGQLVAGTFTAASITADDISMDSLLVLMANGQSYVNVHTAENPGGEIRGQITD